MTMIHEREGWVCVFSKLNSDANSGTAWNKYSVFSSSFINRWQFAVYIKDTKSRIMDVKIMVPTAICNFPNFCCICMDNFIDPIHIHCFTVNFGIHCKLKCTNFCVGWYLALLFFSQYFMDLFSFL